MPSEEKNKKNQEDSGGSSADIQSIEMRLLLEAVFLRYGYDFRNYSKSHLRRRIVHHLGMNSLSSVSELQAKIMWDRSAFNRLMTDLSINVTEMFRDPEFYQAFRTQVIPMLSTYAHIKIWHAGCSTGEEVYSLAILLKEAGLLGRAQIYATDFNKYVLEVAREGIYRQQEIELYEQNYLKAGGQGKLSDYYTSRYGSVIFDKSLTKKVVFVDHNLATDGVFAEVNVIVCRNVLIYFDRILQSRVIDLFYHSLPGMGVLCLGTRESLRFSEWESSFAVMDPVNKIFKKDPTLAP
jgi:chemotaxis protein methyltransferase CheR